MLTPIKAVLLALLASSSAIAVPVVGTAPGKPKPAKSLELPSGFPSKLPSIFPTGGHPKPTFTPVKPSFEPSVTPPVKPSKSVYDYIAARAPSSGFPHHGYPKPSNESLHKPSGTGTKPSFIPHKPSFSINLPPTPSAAVSPEEHQLSGFSSGAPCPTGVRPPFSGFPSLSGFPSGLPPNTKFPSGFSSFTGFPQPTSSA